MIPYTKHTIASDDIKSVIKALTSGWLTQGSAVSEFEKALSQYCGTKYAAVFNSGTAALHAAVFCSEIGEGDEVVTTPLSFVATSNSVLYESGTVVFADVDYETGMLDPKEVERKIGKKTKAVITVDYGGHPSFLKELKAICKKNNLVFINDACHSLGATYFGKRVGPQADITAFSFHPAKGITTAEGGAIVTNSKKFYERALVFRNHGVTKDSKKYISKEEKSDPWYFEMHDLGYNYRLSDINCALGISQIKKLDKFIEAKAKIAQYYTEKINGDARFVTPKKTKGNESAWHLYPVRLADKSINKKDLFKKFNENGIFPQVHFIPIHTHPYYKERFGYKWGDYPKAESFYREEISLPMYPTLKKGDIDKVIRVLKG